MGGAAQARVPQRTPGWVLWTVGEILNYAVDPEPNVMFGCTFQPEPGSQRVTARIPWLCRAMTNVHYQSPI